MKVSAAEWGYRVRLQERMGLHVSVKTQWVLSVVSMLLFCHLKNIQFV